MELLFGSSVCRAALDEKMCPCRTHRAGGCCRISPAAAVFRHERGHPVLPAPRILLAIPPAAQAGSGTHQRSYSAHATSLLVCSSGPHTQDTIFNHFVFQPLAFYYLLFPVMAAAGSSFKYAVFTYTHRSHACSHSCKPSRERVCVCV